MYAYRADREAAGEPIPEGNCDLSATCESLDEWLWTIARHAEVDTDRAHVMIAAALLGKRVRYRASSYHKVPAIAEYALADYPVRRAQVPVVQTAEDESTVREALLQTAREHLQLLPDDFMAQHQRLVVTVVILSWHRLEQTLRAVQSLREHARIPFRLLLLDNHSEAETQAALRALSAEHDFIELHLLPENLGAAGGRNLALDYVTTEYLLLLDNDVEVFPGTLEHLLWQMETHPDAVAVTGRVIFPNGRVHLCGADYHTADGLLHYELFGFGQHYTEPPGVTSACGWVPGCLTLVRTAMMIEQRYDLGMRNYYEDVEWCYRLNEQGRGRFYRCVEAIGLHDHEVKGADVAPTAAAHQEAMRYIETIAHFYAVHGQIIPNLFTFVPELGAADDPQSVAAARLLLTLVQSRGSEWALREWNDGRLQPLFSAPQFAQSSAQPATQQSVLDQTQIELEQARTEAAHLTVELQATQAQVQHQTQAREELQTQIQQQGREVGDLQAELQQQAREVGELQTALQQQAREREELQTQLQQRTREREELQAQLQQQAREREELQTALQQQAREREEVQAQLQQEMSEGEELQAQLQQQAQAREALQAQLEQRIFELGEIHRSRYWKALGPYWRLREALRRWSR